MKEYQSHQKKLNHTFGLTDQESHWRPSFKSCSCKPMETITLCIQSLTICPIMLVLKNFSIKNYEFLYFFSSLRSPWFEPHSVFLSLLGCSNSCMKCITEKLIKLRLIQLLFLLSLMKLSQVSQTTFKFHCDNPINYF